MQDMRQEMLERDNQLAEDMRRLHDRQDALQAKTDEKIDGLIKQVQNLTLAAIVVFSAIVAAMSGLIVAVLK